MQKSEAIRQLKDALNKSELHQLTAGDGISFRLRDTPYSIENGCLYREYQKGGEQNRQYLANFYIEAEAETVRDNGQERERTFRLRAICEGDELTAEDIPAKDYSSMSFISQTWGLSLRPAVGQNVLAYIRDSISAQAHFVRREYIYTHTGWRKTAGGWAFLHAGGAIGAQGVRVELDGRLSRYALQPCEDLQAAQEAALGLLRVAPREVIIPLLGFAFLTPLGEFLRQAGFEPAFIVYLLGVTGAMKSTLAALLLCFFGSFDNKSLPASFKDTANSLEKQGFLLKDVLTVVDDYHPTGSRQEAVKMQSVAQSLSRMYGDRAGRGRMNADSSLRRSYIPRGNLLITGEDIADIGQSGAARHVVIELSKGDIDRMALSELQEQSGLLSACMSSYIEWLIPQADTLPGELAAQFKMLRSAAQSDSRHGRIAEAIAHLQIGMLLFLEFMTATGGLTEQQKEEMAGESWEILCGLAEKQSKRLEQDRPPAMFLGALRELIATSQVIVNDLSEPEPLSHGPNFIGYRDKQFFYLFGDTAYKAVVQFYSAQGRSFPLTKNGILRQLGADGILLMNGSECTRTKKIGGKVQRIIWLRADALL